MTKLTDFTPDPHNANVGTERGVYMLDTSIANNGAGRSILVTKDNVVIAGNKTQQAAIDIGIEDAIVVDTDGTQLVVVRRTDLQSGTPEAIGMAIADNRSGEVGLAWDTELLAALNDEMDLSAWWHDDELSELLGEANVESESLGDENGGDFDMIVCPHCGGVFTR